MKVLVITTVRFRQNGITSVIMNYYRNLNKKLVSMDFIGPNAIDSTYASEFSKNNSKYIQLASRKKNIFKYIFDLYTTMRKGQYDIVHVHGSSHLITLELFIAKVAGIKVRIAHSHNTKCDHELLHKLLTPIFNYSYNYGIACSKEAGKWLFNKKNFLLMHNGIDLSNYKFDLKTRTTLRKELGLTENDFVIGNIAGFIPVKNHNYIIKLFNELNKVDKDIKCILLGDGSLFDEIKDKIKRNNLLNNVLLLGNKIDVYKYYNVMDVFILPSLYEGFPMVLVEAQSNGLYSIVSDTVSDSTNLTGLVAYLGIQEENIDKWAKKLLELKNTKFNRERDSNDAQNKLKNEGFDIKDNTNKLFDYYIRAIKEQVK